MTAKQKKALAIGGIVIGVALMGVIAWLSMGEQSKYEAATDAFLETLRKGDFDRAYADLSPKRKTATSAADFRALVDHPAFRQSTSHTMRRSRTEGGAMPPDGACVKLVLSGAKEWHTQLFLARGDGGAWRVESFALQEDGPVGLEDLLEECGDGPARRAGYSGPPVVNRTTRLR